MRATAVPTRRSRSPRRRRARCGSCGFYLQLAGSMRQAFGVCGNEYAPDDAQVVSVDHGCGAHSEVLVEQVQAVDELPTVFDDSEVESVSVSRAPDRSTTPSPPSPMATAEFELPGAAVADTRRRSGSAGRV